MTVEDPGENRRGFRATLASFCRDTTMHGLGYLVTLWRRPLLRVVWAGVVLTSFIGMSLHLYEISSAYLKHRTTVYSYEDNRGYNFPDVTICNANEFSESNMAEVLDGFPGLRCAMQTGNESENEACGSNRDLRAHDLFWILEKEDAVKAGHGLRDLVLSCHFERGVCQPDTDFEMFRNPKFFNCYTFKKGREGLTTAQGFTVGLALILYLEPHNTPRPYTENQYIGSEEGARVILTPPTALPVPVSLGYDVLVGHSTALGFSVVEKRRLSEPYNSCRPLERMEPLLRGLRYSYLECRNTCIRKYVMERCGCQSAHYPSRVPFPSGYENVTSCAYYATRNKTLHETMTRCQSAVYGETKSAQFDYGAACRCFPACEDIGYPVTISQSTWPAENTVASFLEKHVAQHPDRKNLKAYRDFRSLELRNASRAEMTAWVRRSFLRLNVFATSSTVLIREEIPLYTAVDLLCQIGGCLGLWLGISVVTWAELLHLFFSLVASVFSPEMKRWSTQVKHVEPMGAENSGKTF